MIKNLLAKLVFGIIKTTSNSTINIMQLLRDLIPLQNTSRQDDIDLPTHSPALTNPDLFFVEFFKCKLYANKRKTLGQLKPNIRNKIIEIPPDIYEKVIKMVLKRAHIC